MTASQTPDPGPADGRRLVPYRRQPQLVPFVGVGGAIGLALGMLAGWLGPDAPGSTLLQEIILIGAVGLLLGALVAAFLYLLADRSSLRR